MITRKQYMDNDATHEAYYGQFVTPEIKAMVLERVSVERLVKSTDEHLNDIPLFVWDRMAGANPTWSYRAKPELRGHDGSLATAVCILKQAARQVIEENRAIA